MTDPARLISPRAVQARFAPLAICSEATCKSLILRHRINPRWLLSLSVRRRLDHLIPDSPSAVRPECHDGANHSLSVWPEHLSVPPDSVLRLRVGSASTQRLAPLRLTPAYRPDRDLPGRGLELSFGKLAGDALARASPRRRRWQASGPNAHLLVVARQLALRYEHLTGSS
jgi:hypothetical protein